MNRNYVKITLFIIIVIATFFALSGNVNATSNVAKIGTNEYLTLEEAVLDVPKNETETTITLLRNVESGTGFIVEAGQNIIIDFNNFSYDASNTLVGSTGTQTNGCQLLKGATVIFKNGTLISTSAKILIQNYCDLTLNNMNIISRNAQYVLSNNCGKVDIIGNTSITAKTNGYAFDMCWAPNIGNYGEGTQITVNTTGKITGNIELDVWGNFSDTNGIKSTLKIKNITHEGIFTIDERLENQLTIEGGIFASDISKYLSTEYVSLKITDSQYKVGLKATNLSVASSLEILAGKSKILEATVTPTASIEKVTYSTDNSSVATVDVNGNITALAAGKAIITAKIGNIEKECIVTVKEIIVDGNESEVSKILVNEATEKAITEGNTSVVLNLKEEGKNVTSAKIPLDTVIDIKNLEKVLEVQTNNAIITLDSETLNIITKDVVAGESITLKFEEIKEEELTSEQKEVIKSKEVAMVFSAELMVGAESISDFNGGKVTIKIPFTAPEGTIGNEYKIIFIADDGKIEEISTKYENGYLIASFGHFSNYAVVKNTVVTNKINEKDITPKTGNANYINTLGIIVVITILGIAILKKTKTIA